MIQVSAWVEFLSQGTKCMSDDLFLIDTNILVYAYNQDDAEKRDACKALVEKCWNGTQKYAVSMQNLSEFYVIITQKIKPPVSTDVAKRIVQDIIDFSNWQVLEFNSKTLISAMKLNARHNIHYWDALICATMMENGITCVYTENVKDFSKIPGLTVVNPVL